MLVVDGLKKSFGTHVALQGASFEAHPGRIVGFLGPNGAGKTTTMRCILGLLRPDEGRVTWKGEPVSSRTRLAFGYMPEERGLYPKMKVADQLAYFGRLSGMSSAEATTAATAWLDRLGLADRSRATVEQLSHGNKQRVQLAASLVHSPTLAVLDEPFSGLDPLGTDALSAQLRALARQGTTIVFSSHQLDLVEDVCEDVVIINNGRVVLTGTLEELRSSSTVRRLSVEVDGRPWRPTRVPVEEPGSLGGVGSTSPHVLIPAGVGVDDVLAEAREAGSITSFNFDPPSLSDMFREAVQP
jgi:ABC-2 type transport system ATP-binding protein